MLVAAFSQQRSLHGSTGRLCVRHRRPPPLLLLDGLPNQTAPWSAVVSSVRAGIDRSREATAYSLTVTPAWVDVGVGSVLYVALNAVFVAAVGDGPAGRLLALGSFVALLQLADKLPPSLWLKLEDEPSRIDPSPFFQSRSPLAGATFAVAFGLAVAVPAQLLGLEWVPAPRPWPDFERASLLLAVAPLSEEACTLTFGSNLRTKLEHGRGEEGHSGDR